MAKLNEAQIHALRVLATGPQPTSNKTADDRVSGVVAKTLAGMGLCSVKAKKGVSTQLATINAAGRKALAKAEKDLAVSA